ncbi:putative DNA-binding domain-containing protein [Luteimonas salinilitoris]|uniref:DNA-binding domain-containing protein n=1 Tax=Luteimonas salinilitoris TaxID=3237697 RepID=A0ABV4HWT0_9GAMM
MTATASQQDFAAALRVPTRRAPTGLKAAGRADAERRFAVHRNNFVVTLIDALAEAFPVTQALVGVEFFRAMARECVLTPPPRTPVLTDYAIDFPRFVAGFLPAAEIPYLADVATIEALRIHAYHAADATPIPEAAYRELFAAPERLASARVMLHPACRWLASRHAAYSIWRAHQGLHDLSDADLAGIDVEQAEDVLVARPSFEVVVTDLPPGAIAFLDALRNGEPLGAAFDRVNTTCVHVDASALFAVLIRHGLEAGPAIELEH